MARCRKCRMIEMLTTIGKSDNLIGKLALLILRGNVMQTHLSDLALLDFMRPPALKQR
jgi:hypothetical protein